MGDVGCSGSCIVIEGYIGDVGCSGSCTVLCKVEDIPGYVHGVA